MDVLKDSGTSGLLIWDAEAACPPGATITMLWRSYPTADDLDIISIPQLIEESPDALRKRYLTWVYELGELRIKGKRLVDHLQIRPGFSYWWMTLLVEKCNFAKSPQIDDAIRFQAFTDWVVGRSFKRITLVSSSEPLAECLGGWCEETGAAFEWQRLPEPIAQLSWVRRAYTALPLIMQAWLWFLKYLLERWPLRGSGLQAWRQTAGHTTFVTYSDNCVPEAVKEKRYESRYWANLPDTLKQEARPAKWLHIYVRDGQLTTARHAASVFDAFNQSANGLQCHVTLDTFIGLGVVLRTVRDWLCLVRKGMRLSSDLNSIQGSLFDLWPMLREDWRRSVFGVAAINNILYLNLFEAALKTLPKQQQGVFLQENMGWEFGFIHAWRAAGHERLIGAPHSTVRFWDLRFFFDSRSYSRTGHNDLPLPDLVACNGPVMRAAYQQGGYPAENLVDVEALRYLHLGQRQCARRAVPKKINEPLHLLVLGDYLADNTQLQMRLLDQAASYMPQSMDIVFKPHPNCPIQVSDYPALHIRLSMEPIEKLLDECDVAYASATTSAAVDAYCAGVQIISVLDPNAMNLSPLRGSVGSLFIRTAVELTRALIYCSNNSAESSNRPKFFTTDEQLPNWRKLLL